MIDPAADSVDNRAVAVQFQSFHCLDDLQDIGKLSDTGRLDQNVIGMIGIEDHLQCGFEVSLQRAADASTVDFIDLNAGFLQESTVDADLTELVLYQDDFLSGKNVFNQLLDQCCFSCSEESGNHVYFSHGPYVPPFHITLLLYNKRQESPGDEEQGS